LGFSIMAKPGPVQALIDVSDEKWTAACRREALIRRLVISEGINGASIRVAARDLSLSRAQIYRLILAFRENPVTQSLVLDNPGPRKGARKLPARIEEIIEEAIEKDYLRRERPTVQHLLQEIRRACRAAGLKPPSRKAVSARLASRSLKDIASRREGSKAAANHFNLVKQGLRPTAPLDLVQIDHTKVDLQLLDEATRKLLGRPWLTLLLDVYTRCVLGFIISFDPPSTAGVGLAIAQAVLPKRGWLADRKLDLAWPMQGLPKKLHLDNGKEFHSRALKRGCKNFGVDIDYRPPATPRFGGHIERLMGTLMKRVHALPGSTSSNVVERGDYPSEDKAVLTLSEFERVFALEVLGPYHNDIHSTLGKTPAAAWAEGIAKAGDPRMPPNPADFVLHFLPYKERIVGRAGVRLFNIMYFDGTLAPLLDTSDRKRRVKYNPYDMSTVFLELAGNRHLPLRYADIRKPPISLWEHRLATRTLRENGRASVDEDTIFQAIEERRRIVEQAKAHSKAARRDFARLPKGSKSAAVNPATEYRSQAAGGQLIDNSARVPKVIEEDAWKTRILS
jgi:putative transposase